MDFIPRGITHLSSQEATVLVVAIAAATIFFTTIVYKIIDDSSILIKIVHDRYAAMARRKERE